MIKVLLTSVLVFIYGLCFSVYVIGQPVIGSPIANADFGNKMIAIALMNGIVAIVVAFITNKSKNVELEDKVEHYRSKSDEWEEKYIKALEEKNER